MPWLLRLATYFVLLCAAFIFVDIGWKGGPVVFQRHAPFINVPFLTESPETLNVFELNGQKATMGDRAFRQYKAAHEAELKGVAVETYVYSAGGIFPNIVGTFLLVIGSISIDHIQVLSLKRSCDNTTAIKATTMDKAIVPIRSSSIRGPINFSEASMMRSIAMMSKA